MIPVTPQPEPPSFATTVRQPGTAFLRAIGRRNPTKDEWKNNAYWKNCLPDLRARYGAVCAYSSCWVPISCSVDHFWPKHSYKHLAYEWNNYRLASEKMNNNKGNQTGVLDPFNIQLGWFQLDLATFLVRPAPGLPAAVTTAVNESIRILQLNSDSLVECRHGVLKDYSDSLVPLVFLQRRYPFVAYELTRQGRQQSIIGTIP